MQVVLGVDFFSGTNPGCSQRDKGVLYRTLVQQTESTRIHENLCDNFAA
jgi:hypothetical protein